MATPDFDSKQFLKNLSTRPGVYRMLNETGIVLYVGKAKNLKNRVSSYFQKNLGSTKTKILVSKIANVEVTITGSETEALLLEQSLIKELKPQYNILLRDDKSYPYIFVSTNQEYPRFSFHRGAKRRKGEYLGPYPGAGAVRETLATVEKIFKVRSCKDSYFSNRSRPCLQYQINRCTGPCVGAVSAEDYREQVRHARMFLQGRNTDVTDELIDRMHEASEQQEYEVAAQCRDQIANIRHVQEKQFVEKGHGDFDVFGISAKTGGVCIEIIFVRHGRVLGNRSYYPKNFGEVDKQELLSEFLPQYYLSSTERDFPKEIVLPLEIEDKETFEAAFQELRSKKITISSAVRGDKLAWLRMAQVNADENIESFLANKENSFQRMDNLRELLALEETPQRLECFDISHISGEETVASCVVFDRNGPLKQDYRRFNIKGVKAGDDYGAIKQAVERRYKRMIEEEAKMPDIVLIDGGKGQLTQAREVAEELQLDSILFIAVSKGPDRRPGDEQLHFFDSNRVVSFKGFEKALHLIQHIRDESHRFAISGHRSSRNRARKKSILEGIPGVGPKKRKELLNHFGGIQGIERASAIDLENVNGISKTLATQIYDYLHDDA